MSIQPPDTEEQFPMGPPGLQGLTELIRIHTEILAHVSDAVIAVDNEQRVTYLNAAAGEQYGVGAPEALGRRLGELYTCHWFQPEDEGAAAKSLGETGQWRGENLHIKGNGEAIYVESTVTRLCVGNSAHSGQIAIIRNITERKRAEAALRESEQRYRAIGESISYGIWLCGPDGRNIYASPSFLNMVGLTQKAYADSDWTRILHPDDAKQTIAAWNNCLRSGENWDSEYRLRGIDGRWHPVLARGVAVRDEKGQITGWAGIHLEISRLKKAKQCLELVQAQLKAHTRDLEKTVTERTAKLIERTAEREKLQSEILKISEREKQLIAQELHDGLCQHLAGTAMMGSVLHRRLAATQDPNAAHAKEILELLNTAVLEARNLSHGLHPVKDKGEGLMEALATLAQSATNLFHIQCTFCCEEPVIIDDQTTATHLFRMSQEAINNAIKHGQASKVLITLNTSSEGVRLSIQDDGIGISNKLPATRGMGVQIMNHRAEVIGATLSIRRAGSCGTVVACTLPTR